MTRTPWEERLETIWSTCASFGRGASFVIAGALLGVVMTRTPWEERLETIWSTCASLGSSFGQKHCRPPSSPHAFLPLEVFLIQRTPSAPLACTLRRQSSPPSWCHPHPPWPPPC